GQQTVVVDNNVDFADVPARWCAWAIEERGSQRDERAALSAASFLYEPARGRRWRGEFTRHPGHVLQNLDELRRRHLLTDVTLVVGGARLRAHCAVLWVLLLAVFATGRGASPGDRVSPGQPGRGQRVAAAGLHMEHVADTCRAFMQMHREKMAAEYPQVELDSRVSVASVAGLSAKPGAFPLAGVPGPREVKPPPALTPSSPDSPTRSRGQPSSPAASNTCSLAGVTQPPPDPKSCHWKKYKYIVLNPLCAVAARRGLEKCPVRLIDRGGPPATRRESYYAPCVYSGNVIGTKALGAGDKPYRCHVCGAQFNRPANLKTHSRIHSGEKPYRCDTCGARFVQVAHLRAHVLIHTGEKPYPCHTCGTRFRHLQTLKSHLRIHTGEKPYTCEPCDLHFRHKSQLRLHLRQKHGAVTNTKVRYQVLAEPYQPILQAC
ncbi:hypothetical protein NHX12_014463, partial [Muraenolepis orangiensis]